MRSLLDRLANNWKLKLAALALAVLLWVGLSADQVTSQWLPVPVEVQLRNPAYELVAGPIPKEVEVRFAGPGRDLWELAVNRPPLVLRITEVRDNSIYVLQPQMVEIPAGLSSVSAQDVRPSSVRLVFARIESREVPVAVQVSRGPRDQHVLAEPIEVQPARIRVTGPADRVRQLERVTTRPLDLSREDSVFVRSVVLDTAGLGGLRVSAAEVRVSGRVDSVATRAIARVPVQTPSGTTATPAAVEVQLTGAESILRRLSASDLRVVVPAGAVPQQIPFGGAVVPVRIEQLPTGAEAQANPANVRVFAAPPPPEVVSTPADQPAPDTVPPPDGRVPNA